MYINTLNLMTLRQELSIGRYEARDLTQWADGGL